MHRLFITASAAWLLSVLCSTGQSAAPPPAIARGVDLFTLSGNCMACHNGLSTPTGEDVSIGIAWRATMMANASRDPYWQASVRRETLDHPRVTAEIEDECSNCHMPMAHTAAHASGAPGRVFSHLPVSATDGESRLAQDGVSCTLCHQIASARLGTPESFTGGYVIDVSGSVERRRVYGPYAVTKGLQRIMHSATRFEPVESAHVRKSEVCATCHTLYTIARGSRGEPLGRFPEQVPFQEWQHSRYRDEQSCQSCHMPAITAPTPIASVLAEPREGTRRHTFVGGNFLVLRMLNRLRQELGVTAEPQELEAAARATLLHLQESTARIAIEDATIAAGTLRVDVAIENLSGHKLPTAYPSRRAWIRLAVKDADGRPVFVSGALTGSGAIAGNANDDEPSAFEPHYSEITRADQVQIYESILADAQGAVTTGLLKAVGYAKDNRLLPHGFEKATAMPDIAVRGEALQDKDFIGGADHVRYAIPVREMRGEIRIEAELLYQPIGFRWADNLRAYTAPETRRFVATYDEMAAGTAAPLARATRTVRPTPEP
jgi:hypothetical protein